MSAPPTDREKARRLRSRVGKLQAQVRDLKLAAASREDKLKDMRERVRFLEETVRDLRRWP